MTLSEPCSAISFASSIVSSVEVTTGFSVKTFTPWSRPVRIWPRWRWFGEPTIRRSSFSPASSASSVS